MRDTPEMMIATVACIFAMTKNTLTIGKTNLASTRGDSSVKNKQTNSK